MKKSGFTLIQLSIILTVASLVFVATLPGIQTSLKASAGSVSKMNSVLNTMRGYMAANGVLPCPADPTQATGSNTFGVAAANPGTGSSGNCIGGTPAAAYADTTNHIAIGMIPVKTLGLSYADALDGYGRDITYVVDTNATGNSTGGPCWSSSSLTGAITVNDNGTSYNTIAALVSHGTDGYGAWLPLSGTSGTAARFDNGSADSSQAANAQVAPGGGLTANSTFVSFVRQTVTSTFDDSVVYKSNLYTLNTLPAAAQVHPVVTPPANGSYTSGNTLTFTITYATTVTVTGTPRLDLSALGTGSIGASNKAYATYQSGSGTTALTFSYTVQFFDSAPSGLTMNAYIDLNGGTLSGGSTCFTAPDLTGVLINDGYYRTVTIDHTKVGSSNSSSFPMLFAGTYNYLATTAYGGLVTNANGYDITFTTTTGTLLQFERESYNATTGAVVFWVQVPTVSYTADTVIYLNYGNSNITTDQSNKTGTWNNNYSSAWHLDEASGTQYDSTSNANNFTTANDHFTAQGETTTAKIGGADEINGASDGADTSGINAGLLPANLTVEGWFRFMSFNANESELIQAMDSASPWHSAYLLYVNSSHDVCMEWVNTSLTQYNACGATALSTNTWYHIAGSYNNSTNTLSVYLNGSLTNSATTTGTLYQAHGYVQLGDGGTSYTPYGYFDEVRVSQTNRSSDWILSEYNNQSAPDKATYGSNGFYTVGSQQASR